MMCSHPVNSAAVYLVVSCARRCHTVKIVALYVCIRDCMVGVFNVLPDEVVEEPNTHRWDATPRRMCSATLMISILTCRFA